MSKENRNFVALLCMAAIMLVGVVAQNIIVALKPKTSLKIDVNQVRQDIDAAGLTLREAMHWREL